MVHRAPGKSSLSSVSGAPVSTWSKRLGFFRRLLRALYCGGGARENRVVGGKSRRGVRKPARAGDGFWGAGLTGRGRKGPGSLYRLALEAMEPRLLYTGVTNLAAAAVSPQQVNVNWSTVAGATRYEVFRSAAQDFSSGVQDLGGVTSGSFADTSVGAGTSYYRVQSYNSSNSPLGYSNVVSATINGTVPAPSQIGTAGFATGAIEPAMANPSTLGPMSYTGGTPGAAGFTSYASRYSLIPTQTSSHTEIDGSPTGVTTTWSNSSGTYQETMWAQVIDTITTVVQSGGWSYYETYNMQYHSSETFQGNDGSSWNMTQSGYTTYSATAAGAGVVYNFTISETRSDAFTRNDQSNVTGGVHSHTSGGSQNFQFTDSGSIAAYSTTYYPDGYGGWTTNPPDDGAYGYGGDGYGDGYGDGGYGYGYGSTIVVTGHSYGDTMSYSASGDDSVSDSVNLSNASGSTLTLDATDAPWTHTDAGSTWATATDNSPLGAASFSGFSSNDRFHFHRDTNRTFETDTTIHANNQTISGGKTTQTIDTGSSKLTGSETAHFDVNGNNPYGVGSNYTLLTHTFTDTVADHLVGNETLQTNITDASTANVTVISVQTASTTTDRTRNLSQNSGGTTLIQSVHVTFNGAANGSNSVHNVWTSSDDNLSNGTDNSVAGTARTVSSHHHTSTAGTSNYLYTSSGGETISFYGAQSKWGTGQTTDSELTAANWSNSDSSTLSTDTTTGSAPIYHTVISQTDSALDVGTSSGIDYTYGFTGFAAGHSATTSGYATHNLTSNGTTSENHYSSVSITTTNPSVSGNPTDTSTVTHGSTANGSYTLTSIGSATVSGASTTTLLANTRISVGTSDAVDTQNETNTLTNGVAGGVVTTSTTTTSVTSENKGNSSENYTEQITTVNGVTTSTTHDLSTENGTSSTVNQQTMHIATTDGHIAFVTVTTVFDSSEGGKSNGTTTFTGSVDTSTGADGKTSSASTSNYEDKGTSNGTSHTTTHATTIDTSSPGISKTDDATSVADSTTPGTYDNTVADASSIGAGGTSSSSEVITKVADNDGVNTQHSVVVDTYNASTLAAGVSLIVASNQRNQEDDSGTSHTHTVDTSDTEANGTVSTFTASSSLAATGHGTTHSESTMADLSDMVDLSVANVGKRDENNSTSDEVDNGVYDTTENDNSKTANSQTTGNNYLLDVRSGTSDTTTTSNTWSTYLDNSVSGITNSASSSGYNGAHTVGVWNSHFETSGLLYADGSTSSVTESDDTASSHGTTTSSFHSLSESEQTQGSTTTDPYSGSTTTQQMTGDNTNEDTRSGNGTINTADEEEYHLVNGAMTHSYTYSFAGNAGTDVDDTSSTTHGVETTGVVPPSSTLVTTHSHSSDDGSGSSHTVTNYDGASTSVADTYDNGTSDSSQVTWTEAYGAYSSGNTDKAISTVDESALGYGMHSGSEVDTTDATSNGNSYDYTYQATATDIHGVTLLQSGNINNDSHDYTHSIVNNGTSNYDDQRIAGIHKSGNSSSLYTENDTGHSASHHDDSSTTVGSTLVHVLSSDNHTDNGTLTFHSYNTSSGTNANTSASTALLAVSDTATESSNSTQDGTGVFNSWDASANVDGAQSSSGLSHGWRSGTYSSFEHDHESRTQDGTNGTGGPIHTTMTSDQTTTVSNGTEVSQKDSAYNSPANGVATSSSSQSTDDRATTLVVTTQHATGDQVTYTVNGTMSAYGPTTHTISTDNSTETDNGSTHTYTSASTVTTGDSSTVTSVDQAQVGGTFVASSSSVDDATSTTPVLAENETRTATGHHAQGDTSSGSTFDSHNWTTTATTGAASQTLGNSYSENHLTDNASHNNYASNNTTYVIALWNGSRTVSVVDTNSDVGTDVTNYSDSSGEVISLVSNVATPVWSGGGRNVTVSKDDASTQKNRTWTDTTASSSSGYVSSSTDSEELGGGTETFSSTSTTTYTSVAADTGAANTVTLQPDVEKLEFATRHAASTIDTTSTNTQYPNDTIVTTSHYHTSDDQSTKKGTISFYDDGVNEGWQVDRSRTETQVTQNSGTYTEDGNWGDDPFYNHQSSDSSDTITTTVNTHEFDALVQGATPPSYVNTGTRTETTVSHSSNQSGDATSWQNSSGTATDTTVRNESSDTGSGAGTVTLSDVGSSSSSSDGGWIDTTYNYVYRNGSSQSQSHNTLTVDEASGSSPGGLSFTHNRTSSWTSHSLTYTSFDAHFDAYGHMVQDEGLAYGYGTIDVNDGHGLDTEHASGNVSDPSQTLTYSINDTYTDTQTSFYHNGGTVVQNTYGNNTSGTYGYSFSLPYTLISSDYAFESLQQWVLAGGDLLQTFGDAFYVAWQTSESLASNPGDFVDMTVADAYQFYDDGSATDLLRGTVDGFLAAINPLQNWIQVPTLGPLYGHQDLYSYGETAGSVLGMAATVVIGNMASGGLVGCGTLLADAAAAYTDVQTASGIVSATQDALNGNFGVSDALNFLPAITWAVSPGGCFVAGTQVVTHMEEEDEELSDAGGGGASSALATRRYTTQDIELLRAGDVIVSRDETNRDGTLVNRVIEEAFNRTVYALTFITMRSSDGIEQTICTTNEHPVYVEEGGWLQTRELREGDQLHEPGGGRSTVMAIRVERHKEGVTVYNFRVFGSHTYFVREDGAQGAPVWVHNSCIGDAIDLHGSEITSGENAGQIMALDPETNEMQAFSRSELDGDHVLSKNAFQIEVEKQMEASSVSKLSADQSDALESLLNSKENLRPMPSSFNRSKQAFSAYAWKDLGTDLTKRVSPLYIKNVSQIQNMIKGKIRAIISG